MLVTPHQASFWMQLDTAVFAAWILDNPVHEHDICLLVKWPCLACTYSLEDIECHVNSFGIT